MRRREIRKLKIANNREDHGGAQKRIGHCTRALEELEGPRLYCSSVGSERQNDCRAEKDYKQRIELQSLPEISAKQRCQGVSGAASGTEQSQEFVDRAGRIGPRRRWRPAQKYCTDEQGS